MWLSTDPLQEKYPNISTYAYTFQNPIKYIDPDGKDVIVIIWSTGTEHGVGHAGIAIANYKEEYYFDLKNPGKNTAIKSRMVPDGTYTFYDNWPGEQVTFNLEGAVQTVTATRFQEEIKSETEFTSGSTVSPGETKAPNGVVKLSTSYEQDMKVKNRIEMINRDKKDYNGAWYNCSTFVSDALKSILGSGLGEENMLGPIVTSTTPNQLWKDVPKAAEKKNINTTILLDPGTDTDVKFKDQMKGPN